MEVSIREFDEHDIPYKVRWINDDRNNKYLHYELPLDEDKTFKWFNTLNGRNDRLDCTIICNGDPVGLIGLLNIDLIGKEAEYYICLGENEYKGKGIGKTATNLLVRLANDKYKLKTIYLFTEVGNINAQRLFEKCGFQKKENKNALFYNGSYINRYIYTLNVNNYIRSVEVMKIDVKKL